MTKNYLLLRGNQFYVMTRHHIVTLNMVHNLLQRVEDKMGEVDLQEIDTKRRRVIE